MDRKNAPEAEAAASVREVLVTYTVKYQTVLNLIEDGNVPLRDQLSDAICDIDIPETEETRYIDESFELVECIDTATNKPIRPRGF